MHISAHYEPQLYHQTVRHEEWRTGMQAELTAMESSHMWSIVPLPPGKYSIGYRWSTKLSIIHRTPLNSTKRGL